MRLSNTSHAVMSQRFESHENLDDFPTPHWATRALLEYVLKPNELKQQSCWEPACGRGYMSETLKEYFGSVCSSDIFDYGYKNSSTIDFLKKNPGMKTDWIITNPPFKHAEEFIQKGLAYSEIGVAVLVRTVFLESIGRYRRLFSLNPPSFVAQFSERVPMVKGRIDPKASTATGYAWMVWKKQSNFATRVVWIPPCKSILAKASDFNQILSEDRL